jgi:hypothetical protein
MRATNAKKIDLPAFGVRVISDSEVAGSGARRQIQTEHHPFGFDKAFEVRAR